jgi:hypothetical protein
MTDVDANDPLGITMKSTSLLLALLAITTSTAMANNLSDEKIEFEHDMAGLSSEVAQEVFAQVEVSSSFEEVEYQSYIVEHYNKIYVTRHEAKELGLERVAKFHVFDKTTLDKVSDEIKARIEKEQPDYFSVDLFREFHSDTHTFRYFARVIEYK